MRSPFSGRIELGIELEGREPWHPGDAVRGRVRVARGGDVRTLHVRLAYVERSPDHVTDAFVAGEVVLARGALVDGATFPFAFALPADALPSMEAPPHARVGWELRAWADVLGRDPDDVLGVRVEVPSGRRAPSGRFGAAPEAPGGP